MPFGGAGPVHAAEIGAELGIKEMLIPRLHSPVLCALGDAIADIRETRTLGYFTRESALDTFALTSTFERLRRSAMAALPLFAAGYEVSEDRYLEMRYVGQTHEVTLRLPSEIWPVTDGNWREVRRLFDVLHHDLYSFSRAHSEVEVIGTRLDYWAFRERKIGKSSTRTTPSKPSVRQVWLPESKVRADVPVYSGTNFSTTETINGPVLIDEPNTTVVVLDGQSVELGVDNLYRIREEH
jgi:N-methylhydantoinase A